MRSNWAANHTRPKHDQRPERPHGAAKSRPGPFGLRGSLPPLAAANRSSCLGRVQRLEQKFVTDRAIQIATMKGDYLCPS